MSPTAKLDFGNQRRLHKREGIVDKLRLRFCGFGPNCVVPFAVEGVADDIELGHFGVGDFDAGGIEIFIELATHRQAGGRGGRCDEFDDGTIVDKWSSPPIA